MPPHEPDGTDDVIELLELAHGFLGEIARDPAVARVVRRLPAARFARRDDDLKARTFDQLDRREADFRAHQIDQACNEQSDSHEVSSRMAFPIIRCLTVDTNAARASARAERIRRLSRTAFAFSPYEIQSIFPLFDGQLINPHERNEPGSKTSIQVIERMMRPAGRPRGAQRSGQPERTLPAH